jgi:glycosyltransferase involved in cell wall biosynthesis
MIKVSIIMPVYNGEEYIRNDGSEDNTKDIIKEFDCKLIDRSENMGIGYSRREGLEYASGEYIMFFDSDDKIVSDNFNKALEMLDGSDIVYYDLLQNDGVRLHLSPATKGIYPGAVKFIKKTYIDNFEYPIVRKYEDVKFNGMLNSVEHSEKYTNLVVVEYNFPRYDSTSAKWSRGEL